MLVESYKIIPECYGDTVFVEVLGYKKPAHALNIYNVFKSLKERKADNKSIGIIDNDKQAQRFIKQYKLIESKEGLKIDLRQKENSQHFLIIIKPELEPFIWSCAKEINVNPSDYGFSDIKLLEKACKDFDAHKNERLKNFFNTLKQKQHPAIIQIQQWIETKLK